MFCFTWQGNRVWITDIKEHHLHVIFRLQEIFTVDRKVLSLSPISRAIITGLD